MAETNLPVLTRLLDEQLAGSVRTPLPAYTPRRTFGRVRLPGKATAIVGMRRSLRSGDRRPRASGARRRGALFPEARKRLLTLTRDGLPAEAPADVEVQSACEWLLAPPAPSWPGRFSLPPPPGNGRSAPCTMRNTHEKSTEGYDDSARGSTLSGPRTMRRSSQARSPQAQERTSMDATPESMAAARPGPLRAQRRGYPRPRRAAPAAQPAGSDGDPEGRPAGRRGARSRDARLLPPVQGGRMGALPPDGHRLGGERVPAALLRARVGGGGREGAGRAGAGGAGRRGFAWDRRVLGTRASRLHGGDGPPGNAGVPPASGRRPASPGNGPSLRETGVSPASVDWRSAAGGTLHCKAGGTLAFPGSPHPQGSADPGKDRK